ncbi:MAG: AAA family ATPase [Microcoleaceae cyanobacterium MO_207.B10]|nr:AAA family ATPase [Microcoleaceae cyanobacterium MO_207.B10]
MIQKIHFFKSTTIVRFLSTFLLLITPIAVVIGIIYVQEEKQAKTLLEIQATNSLKGQTNQITREFQLIVSDLRFLAEMNELKLYFEQENSQGRESLAREYLSFSTHKQIYDQIRFLDETGLEIVRVNFNQGPPSIVPEEGLQNKGDRYYFEDTFKLERGEIFVSPFDLNTERGKIEQPLKPMIRFGLPVFDSQNNKRGIVLLNYLGNHLLNQLKSDAAKAPGNVMLLNVEGYWLTGVAESKLWGFMYDHDERKFGNDFPVEWSQISQQKSGQFYTNNGLFTFVTIYPLVEGQKSSTGSPDAFAPSVSQIDPSEYYWKVVSHLSSAEINAELNPIRQRTIVIFLGLGAIILVISLWLTDSQHKHRQAEAKIQEQNEFLNNVINSLTEPFYVINVADYKIIAANAASRKLGDTRNTNCYALTHKRNTPCIDAEHSCPLQILQQTKQPVVVEHIHFDTYGNPMVVEVHGYPIFDKQGNLIQMIEYSLDITARRQAEEELRKLSQAVEQSANAIIITDLSGKIDYVNPQFTKITGYSAKEVYRKTPGILNSGEQTKAYYQELWKTIKSGGEWHGQFHNLKKDGSLYWAQATISPIFDAEGKITHFLGIQEDVTARKEVEDALIKSEAKLRQQADKLARALEELRQTQGQLVQNEKMSSLGQLVAGIAHEINNPVSFIYGNIDHARTYINDLIELIELYQTHYPKPDEEIAEEIEEIELEFIIEDIPKMLASMKQGANRMELVHCHIAKMPILAVSFQQSAFSSQLSDNSQQIPQVLADIVLKLMAKNAEERYQSANGLQADLEECRRQLEETGDIAPFPLARRDLSNRFQIPQKLYGREGEIAMLLEAFERVAETGKVELMLVAGYSGIGKSSLVQELYKPITARRGYFISGKFDQFQRNIPYSAIVASFRGLVGQLLAETETHLQVWREKLLKALDNNGQVIIDVIPEVELIIGKQAPVAVLGPTEAQNRFHLVFANFINVFCDREHPLTLFLDDLQWADLATVKLVERLLNEDETQHLLLLGAYRDNEVSASHPLAIALEKLQQNNSAIDQITLQPLPTEQIAYLIGDTLQQNPETVGDLAKLVWQKTEGNPFFVNEFLQALHDEQLLQFDRHARSWQWDMGTLEKAGFTDNVVELMVGKLQKLPISNQEILSLAACCGAEFSLQLLTWNSQKSPQETFDLLKIALDRGLIFALSEPDQNLLIQFFKFGHDRIQQAAYSLISDRQKKEFNLKIGRLLLENLSPQERNERIFEIVDRLNGTGTLITDDSELLELVKLNLLAGKKAKDANAYVTAREYLVFGMESLTEDSWSTQYDLAFALYKERGLVEYLNGNLDDSEELLNYTLSQAVSALDQAEVYKMLIVQYTMMAKYSDAIESGRQALALLGVDLPKTELKNAFDIEVELAQESLANRNIESLLYEPEIASAEQRMILDLLVSIDPPAYFFDQELYAVIVLKMANLSLTYGNSSESAKGYVTYGIILGSVLGDYQSGYEFGQLAVKLCDRFNSQIQKCPACLVLAGHLNHWVKHIKYAKEIFDDSYHAGLASGELRHCGYALEHQLRYLFYQGVNLQEIIELLPKYLHFLQNTKNQWASDGTLGFQLALLNLLGMTRGKLDFHNDDINEAQYLEDCHAHNSFAWLCTFNIFKSQVLYLYDEYELALAAILEAGKYIDFVLGHFQGSEHNFHYSLVIASLYPEATGETKEQYWQQLESNQKRMKIWADNSPDNFLHKYLLIAAEMARGSGEHLEAMDLYDRAIDSARKNKFIQNEALANELAAKFWLARGKEEFAKIYLNNARYCYQIWGAKRKVEELEAKYSQLLRSRWQSLSSADMLRQQEVNSVSSKESSTAIPSSSITFNTLATSDSTDTEIFDLATTIKSTNAISREIVLDKLLASLMDIIVENAGAGRGILILPRGDGLFVEATKEADLEEISVLQSLPLDGFEKLSEKIVRYVARTRETVVLNDASTEGNFTDDPYIQRYQCQSIACTPLINQNKLQGIVYLENNLSAGAFTQERLALLRTLAAQGAISLENARLYDACQRFVPQQFLSFLEKKSIVDVELGDRVEREMRVLFSDIRDFTSISEKMTPEENFAFINEYLSYMEPQIQQHGGFIDKYIGDAIMALFPNCADDAVKGAIAMLEELKKYNWGRQQKNLNPVRIGIGLHTGRLILGTVGGFGRMDGTVIGDAVNLSSRVEGLTKTYGVSLLITDRTFACLNNLLEYDLRLIEKVKAKGKAKAIGLFEVFSADPPELQDAKIATKEKFERAVVLFYQKSFVEAGRLFEECVAEKGWDRTASYYLERCQGYLS